MLERLLASRSRPCFNPASKWDTLSLDLSGCRFEITLPPHDYEFPEEAYGNRFNVFDETLYRYTPKLDKKGQEISPTGVSFDGILKRNWDTYGFLGSGRIGSLQCSSVVCDISKMQTDLNCFNPSHMEHLILHWLYYSYGPGRGPNEHTTPFNWRIKKIHGTDWVYFERWARKAAWEYMDNTNNEANFTSWLCTATCHPNFHAELENQVAILSNEAVVEDRNIITSQGPGTAMRFALSLVKHLFGEVKANELSHAMVFQP